MNHYRSILLIDDDTEDQEIFLDAIKEVDPRLHCTTANDAEAALKQLNEEIVLRPDILFIDLNMPKINGKQLLKEIKEIGPFERDSSGNVFNLFWTPGH